MATIYLSSTYEDLKDQRRLVYEALRKAGHQIIAMEDYVATDQRPVEKCLQDIEKADIYIGLFAFRYGYVPPASHNNPNGLSITELEFRHAERLKKPILVFIATEAAGISLNFVDAYTGEGAKGESITALRNYLRTEKIATPFTDTPQLATWVLLALTKHLERPNPVPSIARRSTIPHGKTTFIGREDEQRKLREKVLNHCVVTVTGAPGIGKTRLAMHVAGSLESQFHVNWVSLFQLTEPSAIPQRIVHDLDIKAQSGKDLVDLIGEFLQQQKRPLLILDNCDDVHRGCAEVVSRLQVLCAELHVMLTSRIVVGIDAEHLYRVPQLKLPDPEQLPDLDVLARIDSVELLLARLEACSSPTRLTEQNAKKIAQLCCDLSGLPLATMLVAAQMNILDLDAVLEQRTEWLDFSRSDVVQTGHEELTIRNIIRWSYNRLGHEPNGERIQNLFNRLSVFRRGWTIEAARRVCAESHETDTDIQKLMDSLGRVSLIETEEVAGRNRFSYLDIIREFAHKKLEQEGQDKELAVRHARWATEFAEYWQPRLLTKEQVVALPRLFAEVGNFREAFQWACQCHNAEIALRLTSALWRLMEIKGFYSKGEEYLQKALELPGAEKFPLFRAKAFGGLGILAYRRGDLEASERWSRQRLALERKYGTDRIEEADALSDLGIVAMRCGEYQEALDLYTQSLALHEEKKYDRGIAVCRFNIGALFLSMDKLDKAEANVKVSLEKFEKAENERDAAFALNTLGLIERYRGQYDAASFYANRSLAIRRKLGDTGGMAETMVTQANILIGRRHLDEARPLLVESGKLFIQINNERGIAEALEHLASLANHQDFHAKAVILYAAAHELRKKLCIPLPPVAKRDRDTRIESLHHALSDTGFATQWEKGRVMPPWDAFALGVN